MQYALAASQLADFKDISNEMEAWGCTPIQQKQLSSIIIKWSNRYTRQFFHVCAS
jgi:hypothetical protein